MQDSAENLTNALSSTASSKVNGVLATTTAGGLVATTRDPEILGNFLSTHGIWFLSYVEIFQIIGSIYVTYQLLKVTFSGISKIIRFFKSTPKIKRSLRNAEH